MKHAHNHINTHTYIYINIQKINTHREKIYRQPDLQRKTNNRQINRHTDKQAYFNADSYIDGQKKHVIRANHGKAWHRNKETLGGIWHLQYMDNNAVNIYGVEQNKYRNKNKV